MSDLYKEFTDFCEKHNRCKDCEYKDIEHCHFSWTEDKVRADERDRIIEDLEIHAKYCLEVDQSIGDYITVKNCIQIVRGGENE